MDGEPNGYGRAYWKSGVSYHGECKGPYFNGYGTLFRAKGERFEGTFVENKPIEGVYTEGDRRYKVGTKP